MKRSVKIRIQEIRQSLERYEQSENKEELKYILKHVRQIELEVVLYHFKLKGEN